LNLTFIADCLQIDAHHLALRDDGGEPDGLFDRDATSDLAAANRASSRSSFARRILSALFAPVRNRRRRLPPQDDHLRRDIGLSEHQPRPEYWQYYWWDR
jgi:hypothetical protein